MVRLHPSESQLEAKMAHDQNKPVLPIRCPTKYPPDPTSYKILDEIGTGVSAIVYKALCLPLNSALVAIKSIHLDRSRATDFDNLRRETSTMSLLSHPNILQSHCSFTVDRRLWVVMPFMSCGSLQSIISSTFPCGLPEPCITVVLKETLNALSYLHNQGHLHRDVKAGNILVDSDGSIKLADFGVSASVYDTGSRGLMLNDVAGTPYWMAPEVIHSHVGYSFKADIWSFGITALELAHGRPPLSHLPPSKSLLTKVTKKFRFSDYEKKQCKDKKFSKAFKDMVASCLEQDPAKRPSADKLLKHPFFRNCKGPDFLVRNILHGLPSVEERFRENKGLCGVNRKEEEDEEEGLAGKNVKVRRISGWSFNEDGLELDPVFSVEEDELVKQVRFGGETIIKDERKKVEINQTGLESGSGGSGGSNGASPSSPATQLGNIGEVTNRGVMLESLGVLKRSLDEQRFRVGNLIGLFGGEVTKEDQLVQAIEKLRVELENEKHKNFELEMELEFFKLFMSGVYDGGGAA